MVKIDPVVYSGITATYRFISKKSSEFKGSVSTDDLKYDELSNELTLSKDGFTVTLRPGDEFIYHDIVCKNGCLGRARFKYSHNHYSTSCLDGDELIGHIGNRICVKRWSPSANRWGPSNYYHTIYLSDLAEDFKLFAEQFIK